MSSKYHANSAPDKEGTFLSVTYPEVSIGPEADAHCTLDQTAPVRRLVEIIGDRWSMLVLYAIADGPMRFNALERTLSGISQKVLSETLRKLERAGLVTRTVYPQVPPRVDYALSPLGETMRPVSDALCAWSRTHGSKLGAAV